MTKNELRKCFKNKRQSFVFSLNKDEICDLEHRLTDRLLGAGIVAGSIGGYAAMTSEIDPSKLLSHCDAKGHAIALPYFEKRGSEMEFRARLDTLERGPFAVRQPTANSPILVPDTVFVPLVAADRHGNRLGQGQGHFDRALEKMRKNGRVTAIGLAWECQIADELPADPWDEPLDYIATPDRILEMTS